MGSDLTDKAGIVAVHAFATLSIMQSPEPRQIGQIRLESGANADRDELAELVRRLSVVHGRVTLTSGKEADYYVDLRRATLHHRAGPLIGRLIRELTDDWDYVAVGGLTLGADPVAAAVMHAPGRPINAFVVRKSAKTHGMQRLIEGPDISGRRVLVVEDTSTTGASAMTAVRAVREAGGQVVGVVTVVDRATGAAEAIEAEGLPYRSVLGLADLGLAGG
jgi:orotate phosphoribosyltransferase